MKKKGRQLHLVIEGKSADGSEHGFWIYKEKGSFYIVGPNFYEHICHASVKTTKDIENEVMLVFGVTVTKLKQPWELNLK